MIKNITYLFFTLSCIFITKYLYALSTSSYLISHIAFKSSDFKTVFDKFNVDNTELNIKDYRNKLMSLINLHQFTLANEVAIEILKNYPKNQEALIVNFINNLKVNNKDKLNSYKDNDLNDNPLIKYIFFENNELKSNEKISESLVSIVEASFADYSYIEEVNYNYLLFYLSLSIFINPEYDFALFLSAQYYQLMLKYEKANFFYKKINPQSSFYKQAQLNIAFIYGEIFSFDKAEEKIKNLIDNLNNDQDLIKVLADFYRYNSNYELAIKHYTDLINISTSNKWKLFYLRGICYERQDTWQLAENDFLKSLDLKSNSPDVLNYLAYGWIEQDINIDRSLKMLQEAHEANPNSYYILDSLAWAHYKKNNLHLAAELMEKVIDMAPGEAISLDHLGDIYFSLNRNREAIFFWKQAKDLADPEDNIIENIEKKLNLYYQG